MAKDYCVFEYFYRDAGNWKTWGAILLTGRVPAGAHELIEQHCEMGKLFVAEQLGIQTLCDQHFEQFGGPSELDHAFHEYHVIREATPTEIATMRVIESAEGFLFRIAHVAGNWDVRLSPNAWL